MYFASAALMTLGWSLRTEGRRHIPAAGPALLVANHQSFFDPILVGLATRRHLCYLARKTLLKDRAFAWLIRMLNAAPTDQEGVGKEGIKTILEQLRRAQGGARYPPGGPARHGPKRTARAGGGRGRVDGGLVGGGNRPEPAVRRLRRKYAGPAAEHKVRVPRHPRRLYARQLLVDRLAQVPADVAGGHQQERVLVLVVHFR